MPPFTFKMTRMPPQTSKYVLHAINSLHHHFASPNPSTHCNEALDTFYTYNSDCRSHALLLVISVQISRNRSVAVALHLGVIKRRCTNQPSRKNRHGESARDWALDSSLSSRSTQSLSIENACKKDESRSESRLKQGLRFRHITLS